MISFMKKYSDSNNEEFNKDFIMSRNDSNLLEQITDIFKCLEILDDIKVESVTLTTDESEFGPIRQQGKMFKAILPSRLDKIHFVVSINGKKEKIEKDLFINKTIDDCFYLNEGIRYYLIWQIVDTICYSTENSVSLRSAILPVTINKISTLDIKPEFDLPSLQAVNNYEVFIFSKKIPPLFYFMTKYSFEALRKNNIDFDDLNSIIEFKSEDILKNLADDFNLDIHFSDSLDEMKENERDSNRAIFQIKKEKEDELYLSVPVESIDDILIKTLIGMLTETRAEKKKKRFTYSYDELISPWFWINIFSGMFVKSPDVFKRLKKAQEVFVSLDRSIDISTRKLLPIKDEYKKDIFSIFKYMLITFNDWLYMDSSDLSNKRLRLYEYTLFPLRKYFADQIIKILNSPKQNIQYLERIFTNLSPMFIIKQMVSNELLRYYNSSNEIDLFTCLLKYTLRGPQGLSKSVSVYQRDIHPSYFGRLSLIASSAGDPGMTGNICPFVKLYDYYFKEQNTGD